MSFRSKKQGRGRATKSFLVSTCLAVVLALVVGISIFASQGATPSANTGSSVSSHEANEGASTLAAPSNANPANHEDAAQQYQPGELLVCVEDGTNTDEVNHVLGQYDFALTKDVSNQDLSSGYARIEIADGTSVPAAVDVLEAEGMQAQPNFVYHLVETEGNASSQGLENLAVTTNDPNFAQQWGLESVGVPSAWGIQKCADTTVSVAVIDTGARCTHEDLEGNIRATYNSSMTGAAAEARENANDTHGHGTHVAGIISAKANNNTGAVGASYDAGLVIIRATKTDYADDFDTTTLANAYSWLMGDQDGDGQTIAQEQNVRVINMSVGGEGDASEDIALYRQIDKAYDAGILTVCAAGNRSGSAPFPYACIPGDYDKCLSVINLSKTDSQTPNDSAGKFHVAKADSSNYNLAGKTSASSLTKDISAPGTDIYNTNYSSDSSYVNKSGTSMASPLVAGTAALMFASNPSLTSQQAMSLLETTATDIDAAGWDELTGYGEVNAYYALQITSAQIEFADMSYKDSASLSIKAADGSSLDPSEWVWTSSDSKIISIDEVAGTLTAQHVGTATITASFGGPDGISISKDVSVSPLSLESIGGLADIPAQQYTGAPLTPPLEITANGTKLAKGVDYRVQYSNSTNAGTASVVVSGMGNYTGKLRSSFQINTASLEGATITIPNQVFTGDELRPAVSVTHNGRTLVEGTDFDVSYSENKAVGTGHATITGKGNYTGTASSSFVIEKAEKPAPGQESSDPSESQAGQNPPAENQEGSPTQKPSDNQGAPTNQGSSSSGSSSSTPSTGQTQAVETSPSNQQPSEQTPPATKPGIWKKSGSLWWYQYNDQSYPTGWATIDEKRYHFDGNGWMQTGWQRIDGTWYFFGNKDDGSMKTGWIFDGYWYLLGSDGAMKTGWEKVDSTWYYMNGSGAMQTGWVWLGGTWYYLHGSGAMAIGWLKDGLTWYYLADSGAMATGWQKINGTWYYLNGSGAMQTGWVWLGGTWYYLHGSGAMAANCWIGNYWLQEDGSMATSKRVDGGRYYVDGSGAWVPGA